MKRKILSVVLAAALIMNMGMTSAIAADSTDGGITADGSGLCEHHIEHDAECGYNEGSVGSTCTHAHEEACYKLIQCEQDHADSEDCTVESGCVTMELDCQHAHDVDCGYSEGTAEVPCSHTHDDSCGFVEAVAGTPCANAESDTTCNHSGDCGFVAAVEGMACNHTEHADCGYAPATEGTACNHAHSLVVGAGCYAPLCTHAKGQHDETCGYAAVVAASACTFHCNICHEDETLTPASETPVEEPICGCAEKCAAEAVKADCPVCSAEGADLAACTGEEAPVAPACTCETDDPAFHATNCPAYIAPGNPECFCVEKCTEDALNVWCDLCGVQGIEACTGESTAAVYSGSVTVDSTNKVIYANGTPITITGNGDGTATITETNGGAEVDTGSLAGYTIYGGSESGEVASTSITITGTFTDASSPATIYGGGKNGAVTGIASITVNSEATLGWATVASSTNFAKDLSESFRLFGGGESGSVGSTSVTIGGTVYGYVFGGGESGTVGSTSVNVSGTVGQVLRTGSTEANFDSGGVVCGGGLIGNVTDAATVNVTGTVDNAVYGGDNGNISSQPTTGSTSVTFSGTITDDSGSVSGGGNYGSVTGKATVTINGGSPKRVYGGGARSGTATGSVSITVTDGNMEGVYGTRAGNVTGDVTIDFKGGTIDGTGVIYGGSSDSTDGGTVGGNATITVSGGTVPYVRGDHTSTVTGDAVVNITGGTVDTDATADTLTISGGEVTVTHGDFTTGTDGNAKIYIHSQSVTALKNDWKGIIGLQDQTNGAVTHWTVAGNQTLSKDLKLSGGDTLTIPADSILILASGVEILHGGQSIHIMGALQGTADGNNEIVINTSSNSTREVQHNNNVTNVALKFPVKYDLKNGVTAANAPTEIDVFAEGNTVITLTPLSGTTLIGLKVNGLASDAYTHEGNTFTITNSAVTQPVNLSASASTNLQDLIITDGQGDPIEEIALTVLRGQLSPKYTLPAYTVKVSNNTGYEITVTRLLRNANYFSLSSDKTIADGETQLLEVMPFSSKLENTEGVKYSSWADNETRTEELILSITYTDSDNATQSVYVPIGSGRLTVAPAITIGSATVGTADATEITLEEGYTDAPKVSAALTTREGVGNNHDYGSYRLYKTDAENTLPVTDNPLPANDDVEGWINIASDLASTQRQRIPAGTTQDVQAAIPTGLPVGVHWFGMAVIRGNSIGTAMSFGDQWQFSSNAVKVTVIGSLADANVALSGTSATYNGLDQNPTVTVKKGETTLTEGTDYTLEWKNAAGSTVTELKDAGTYTLTIVGKGAYEGSNIESAGTFTISKTTPTYTTPTGLTATYDQTLADVKLPTVNNGTWSWESTAAAVGNVGTQTHKATFTPSDTKNYETITDVEISVVVGKADPAYTVPTGLTATYGQTLNDVTLSEGWQWNGPASSVGNVGENTFAATFTPSDAANYNTVEKNLTVSVGKKSVSITGLSAADRDYNGEKTVTLSGGSIVGTVDSDNVTVDLSAAVGTMADANAGENKAVTVTGVKLGGTAAGNYELTAQPSGVTVNIGQITTSETTTLHILYHDTTAHTVDLSALLKALPGWVEGNTLTYTPSESSAKIASAVMNGDSLEVTLANNLTENDVEKVDVTVEVSGLTNYSKVTIIVAVDITDKKIVTVDASGISVTGKTYDGQQISISGTPTGSYDDNGTSASYTGTFEAVYIGTLADGSAYAPTTTAPADAGSYTVYFRVSQDTAGFTGDSSTSPIAFAISQRQLTWDVSGITVANQEYVPGKTTVDTVSGSPALGNVVSGDDVDFTQTNIAYAFSDDKVGTDKTITATVSGLALSGADATNYILPANTFTLTGNITEPDNGEDEVEVLDGFIVTKDTELPDDSGYYGTDAGPALDQKFGTTGSATITAIQLHMETSGENAVAGLSGVDADSTKTQVLEISLKYWDGDSWEKIDEEHLDDVQRLYPNGVPVTIPYSLFGFTDTANYNGYQFIVQHMITLPTDSQYNIGDVEDLSGVVTATADGLTFKVTHGFSPFMVGFAKTSTTPPTPAVTITGVTVTPATATVNKGATQQFTAAVSGTGNYNTAVTWSISGHTSSKTSINANGLLTIGSNETAASITVKATAVGDATKYATATVTVNNSGGTVDPGHTHNFGSWQYDSKNHWRSCSCGTYDSHGEHSFGEWKVTKTATTVTNGSKERSCSVCGYTETATIWAAIIPQTGDNSLIGLWITLMVLSMGGIFVALRFRKRGAHETRR